MLGPEWSTTLHNIDISLDLSLIDDPHVSCKRYPKGTCSIETRGYGTYTLHIPEHKPKETVSLIAWWTHPLLPAREYPYSEPKPWIFYGALAFVILWNAFLFYRWWTTGREYKLNVPDRVEIHPPEEVSPAEAGLIWDTSFDGRDIAAALVDLAVKGYIKLHDKGKLYGILGPRNIEVEILKVPGTEVPEEERKILSIIASGNLHPGARFSLAKLSKDQKRELKKVEDEIVSNLKRKGYIERWVSWYPVVIPFFVAFLSIWGFPFFAGYLASKGLAGRAKVLGLPDIFAADVLLFINVFICMIWAKTLARLSPKGRLIQKKLEGFEEFVRSVEIDRLKTMYPPEKYTAVFEKFFPYAIALGLASKWVDKWEQLFNIMGTSPHVSWYTGPHIGSISDIADGLSSVSSSTSGSSGSGGAGGGGGGGW